MHRHKVNNKPYKIEITHYFIVYLLSIIAIKSAQFGLIRNYFSIIIITRQYN